MRVIFSIILVISFAMLTNAQNAIPIFDMKSGGLLGGVKDGVFVDSKTASKSVKRGQKLSYYNFLGLGTGEVSTDDFRYLETCDAYHLGLPQMRENKGIVVGEGITWQLFPRQLAPISASNETYRKVLADFLKAKGYKNPEVKITQAISVDLDADGKNEIVLSASRETGEEGIGYSFVLVRKIIGKSVKNILVEGEFHTEKNRAQAQSPEVSTFEISSIADLNGDGKMEIVVNQVNTYYDGGGSAVFWLNGVAVVRIKQLRTGCGFF